MSGIGLYIFTRDLRWQDNTTLIKAFSECEIVIPIFIFNPDQVINNEYISYPSIKFMCESIRYLLRSLKSRGIELFMFHDNLLSIINKLTDNFKFRTIYINKDYSPFAKERETNIKKICTSKGLRFISEHDYLLTDYKVKKPDNTIYIKYTPFYNKAIKNEFRKINEFKLTDKSKIYSKFYEKNKSSILNGLKILSKDEIKMFYEKKLDNDYNPYIEGGRDNCEKILKLKDKFNNYSETRNYPFEETTHLSAFIKFGVFSIREIYFIFKDNKALVSQLIWRDFYTLILDNYPYVLEKNMRDVTIKWVKFDNQKFNCWKEGKTGFPLVDAGMRQLKKTGWIHNRVRMVVADFLVKLLHIEWKHGEKYFANKLIDYDVAVNNGSWQWQSGTGVDSQPYYRIFNPWNQSIEYDKECKYIKKWVPELNNFDSKTIHSWFKFYDKVNHNYVNPILDYKNESKIAKELIN
jgi:deoxyribodipyrimidine photo-lyase